MSDISKCRGVIEMKMCPKRDECCRFTAHSNSYWQSWLLPTSPCELFLPNKETAK